MNNKSKGALAGVAAVALLAGGSTYALWTDDAEADGGTITAGNLAVDLVGSPQWRDVSGVEGPDGEGVDIDLDRFRVIPGDTIEGTFSIDAALEGDNMLAELGITLGGQAVDGQTVMFPADINATYSVLGADDEPITGMTDIPLGTTPAPLLKLWSEASAPEDDATEEDGAAYLTLPANLTPQSTGPDAEPAGVDLTVVLTLTFDADTTDRELVQTGLVLPTVGVQLTQVRPEADDEAEQAQQ
ncbi:alternate-type signal peptide domain-containing protein [Georgenia faecalis]|uniref:Alternate-type signal peptide domain-containing protein n=1 Tax=Georgenia faecalis TaxID=2483799 RepID=A0ABV9D6L2_9MICO|nr:alternate-type signal peptide domain-containing protein [Georgenia faecalis]